MRLNRIFLLFFLCLLIAGNAGAQEIPAGELNKSSREWFQDAKFGMFIHWGLYTQIAGGADLGGAEWIMNKKRIPIAQYEKMARFFNPIAYNPDQWVSMAKAAGVQYITVTSKHHDGFAMYDSQVSDYTIVKRTPYGKDVLKLLKEACDKQGIKLFFYYSQLDWHHPDFFPRGRSGQGYTGREEKGDWNAYIDYMNLQLTELLTNYGPIAGIWFDGMWDKPAANWRLEETYALIHRLQPAALVGSNHHKMPFPGEDFQMFERDLPGENTLGYNKGTPVSPLPLEMCETMNGSWGYNFVDVNYKSAKKLLHTLIKAAGYGSNFLLNTGPMPDGNLQQENMDTLKMMGNWLKKYGETIYGTRKGPIPPAVWGATTQKGNRVWIHVLDCKEPYLFIGKLPNPIKAAKFFDDQSNATYQETEFGVILRIPEGKKKPIDTIIQIDL